MHFEESDCKIYLRKLQLSLKAEIYLFPKDIPDHIWSSKQLFHSPNHKNPGTWKIKGIFNLKKNIFPSFYSFIEKERKWNRSRGEFWNFHFFFSSQYFYRICWLRHEISKEIFFICPLQLLLDPQAVSTDLHHFCFFNDHHI